MKTNIHHVQIKTSDGNISTGHNTKVFVDGKELLGVTSIEYSLDAWETAKLKIEMVANVDIDLRTQIESPEEFKIVNIKGDVIGEVKL